MALITIDSASVDWRELMKQKETLHDLAWETDSDSPAVDDLWGIIHFIDHVQDQAIRVIGDKAVFGE